MSCNCGGYVISTPCEISSTVCKNSFTMISVSSACTYILQDPSHGTVELSAIGSQYYIVYTNDGTGTTDSFSYTKTCNGTTTTCNASIDILDSDTEDLEIFTLTANNTSCPLGGTALYTWTIPECAILLPGYTTHDRVIKVYVYPYNPELTEEQNVCQFSVTVCCSLPGVGVCDTCCECQYINYYPPICVGDCQDEECYCPYPCTYWDETLQKCIFECTDYDLCCEHIGNIHLNLSLACGLVDGEQTVVITPSLLGGTWYNGSIATEETSVIDYDTGIIDDTNFLQITESPSNSTPISWSLTNSQLIATITDPDTVNWEDISTDFVYCYKKNTSCGELTKCYRLVYENINPTGVCDSIALVDVLPNDTEIVQQDSCNGVISYFCATECCDIDDCIINPNCTLNPVCTGGECKCLLNGVYVNPLPNGCCPECINGEPVPGCDCCICINNAIVDETPICAPGYTLNPETCLCDCDCAGGYCRDTSNNTCVPCPTCIPFGSSIIPCDNDITTECSICETCTLGSNGLYSCVHVTCPPGYAFNPNPTSSTDCCVRTDCISVPCYENANIYCPEIPGCTCQELTNTCIPCSVIPCEQDTDCPYGCQCDEDTDYCEGNPCDTIEVNCEIGIDVLPNDLFLTVDCGLTSPPSTHILTSSIIPQSLTDVKWYINITSLGDSWLEITEPNIYGLSFSGTNRSKLIVNLDLLSTNFYLIRCVINGRDVWYQLDGVDNGNSCDHVILTLGGVQLCNTIFGIDTQGWTVTNWHFIIDSVEYIYNPNTLVGTLPTGVIFVSDDEFVYKCSGTELLQFIAEITNGECEISTCLDEYQCNCTGYNFCDVSEIVFSENNVNDETWELSAKVIVPAGTPGFPSDYDTQVFFDCELLSSLQTCSPNLGSLDDITSWDCCLCGIKPIAIAGLAESNGSCNNNASLDDSLINENCDDLVDNSDCNCGNPTDNNNCSCLCGWTYDPEGLELLHYNGNNIKFNIINPEKAKVCFQGDVYGNSEEGDPCCKCKCINLPPPNCEITASAALECVKNGNDYIIPTATITISSNYSGNVTVVISQNGNNPITVTGVVLSGTSSPYSAVVTIPLVNNLGLFPYNFDSNIDITVTNTSQVSCSYSFVKYLTCCLPEFEIEETVCSICDPLIDILAGITVCLNAYTPGITYNLINENQESLLSIVTTGATAVPLCSTLSISGPNTAIPSCQSLGNYCNTTPPDILNGALTLDVVPLLTGSTHKYCDGNPTPNGYYCHNCYEELWSHVGSDISKWNTPNSLGYFNYYINGLSIGNSPYTFGTSINIKSITCGSYANSCLTCNTNPASCINTLDIAPSSSYSAMHFARIQAIAGAYNQEISLSVPINNYMTSNGYPALNAIAIAVPPNNNSVKYPDNITIIENNSSVWRYIVITTERYPSGLIRGTRVNIPSSPFFPNNTNISPFGKDLGCIAADCDSDCDVILVANAECVSGVVTVEYTISGGTAPYDVVITGCDSDYTITKNAAGTYTAEVCTTTAGDVDLIITVTDADDCEATQAISTVCFEDTCELVITASASCEINEETQVIVTVASENYPIDVTVCGQTITIEIEGNPAIFTCTGWLESVVVTATDAEGCEESISINSTGDCCDNCDISGSGWVNPGVNTPVDPELCVANDVNTNNYFCTDSITNSGWFFNYLNNKLKNAIANNTCDIEAYYTITPANRPLFHHGFFTTHNFIPVWTTEFEDGLPPDSNDINYQIPAGSIYTCGTTQPSILDFSNEISNALTEWSDLISNAFNINFTFVEVDYDDAVNPGPISSPSNLPKAEFYFCNASLPGYGEGVLAHAGALHLDISPNDDVEDTTRSYGGYFVINPLFKGMWATENTQLTAPLNSACASASPCSSLNGCYCYNNPVTGSSECKSIKYNSYNIKYMAIRELGHIFNLRHQGFVAIGGETIRLQTTTCDYDYFSGNCFVHQDGSTSGTYSSGSSITNCMACMSAHPGAACYPTPVNNECGCSVVLTAYGGQYISGEDCLSFNHLGIMDNKVNPGENMFNNGAGGVQPFNGSLVYDAYCKECMKKRYMS